MHEFTCCICGKKEYGYGNNPWPVDKRELKKCCDECNLTVVVPARLAEVFKEKVEDKE